MALVLKDRVQEVSTTSGTGTLTLTGAVSGFQTFSTAIGNGNTTYYTIFDNTAYVWEVGIGTVGAGTLARTTVLANSSGTTSPISLAGNSVFVFVTYPAERSINYDADDVATIGEVLGYSDSGIIASFASTVAGYNQVVLQNKSTATNASTNFNVSNDAGTAGSNYAELGINSSTFTGSGSFNIAGASYVASASTDLTLGTYGAYNVHFVTNSSTTDAMTIFNNGGISLGGFANPGIANMSASKFVPGYTSVTAAAGTTVLTASSNYYQNLVGTTTQTFRLPDATTLLVGTTFIFDNNSTGTLTVVDNASGSVETIPSGAAGFIYLANNSTVAGSWNKHSFLPATYDFNATTANFGNATITSAVWNGTTIGTAYGGTGLSGATPFTASNNALYSTSASALVAGTLPVAAGGTSLTTYTTGDIIYASATNTLAKLGVGSANQVLTISGGVPTWAATQSTMVYPGAGIPNSTGTSWGTSYTTSGTGAVVALATSPSFTTPILGTPQSGNFSTGTFTWPTFNQNTTGSAATLTTPRAIYGNNFDGSAALTQIIASTYGGTGNGFTKFSGATTSEKTYTLPDSSTTILTTANTVISGQGGTGFSTYTTGDILYASATNTLSKLPIGTAGQILSVSSGVPAWSAAPSSGLTVGTTSITSGTNGYILYNNAGTLGNLNVTGTGNVVLATSPTVSGVTLNDGYTEEVFPIPSSTTPALSPTNGSIQTWTLTGNSTPTAGTWAAGQSLTLMIDDGTAFTVTWTSLPVTWVGGTAPTLATTGFTVIEFWKVGTTIYGALVGAVA